MIENNVKMLEYLLQKFLCKIAESLIKFHFYLIFCDWYFEALQSIFIYS